MEQTALKERFLDKACMTYWCRRWAKERENGTETN